MLCLQEVQALVDCIAHAAIIILQPNNQPEED